MSIAVTSGLAQIILTICGGLFLREIFEWKLIGIASSFLGLWSLFWPVYAYVGMNKAYRDLIEQVRQNSR